MQASSFDVGKSAMKPFLILSLMAAAWLAAIEILFAAEYLYPPPAPERTAPIFARSYSDYVPYLGGAYRNPDAYLPCYPGYAPDWQRAPYYNFSPFPPLYYPYPFYPPMHQPYPLYPQPAVAPPE
jgi:hypothetical protein